MLGFTEEELVSTTAWRAGLSLSADEAAALLRSKILAYAGSTWKNHRSHLREFQSFCRARGVNPLDCNPPTLCTFLLSLGQNGRSIGAVEAVVLSLNFIYKFYLVNASIVDITVTQVLKFLNKACTKIVNVKNSFGSKEIRLLWDALDKKYVEINKIPLCELRTFVMTVFQHATFCRFSDIAPLKLSDITFHLDYFTVHIRCSKTDQTGDGQWAYVSASGSGNRDPHKLMCLFIHIVHSKQEDDAFLFPPLR